MLNGPVGDELVELIAKRNGIRILAWGFEGPYYNFMSAKKPIHVPIDLQGQKIRTLETPNLVEMVKLAGGTPTPISFSELYTSLQQGVVDGCITADPFVRMIKLDEVLKYINKADFYLGMSNLYISEKFWDKLPAEQKYLIKDAALQAMATFKGLTLWGGTVWGNFFEKEGIEVYVPTPAEMKVWKIPCMRRWLNGPRRRSDPSGWINLCRLPKKRKKNFTANKPLTCPRWNGDIPAGRFIWLELTNSKSEIRTLFPGMTPMNPGFSLCPAENVGHAEFQKGEQQCGNSTT